MDFVDRAHSQLQNLFRSMTPAARWTAGLLAAVVVVGLGYLGTHRSAKPDADLMRGVPVIAAQLPAMEAALAKANLTNYEIRGTSIFVPRGREAVYMAALADANALPRNFGDVLTNAVNAGGPFLSSRDRKQRIKTATQAELSLMIRSMTGIENAYVLYDVDTKPGFGKDKLITATASVKPVGTTQLAEARVSSIRHLIAGAIAGLKPENVTVSDLNGRTWHGKLDETANSPLKKGATAGLSSSAGRNTRENTAGQASSGTRTLKNRLFQRAAKSEQYAAQSPPTADFARAASHWLVQPWNAIGLIGLALVGLLVLRSIARGTSAGAKQTTASISLLKKGATAGLSSSAGGKSGENTAGQASSGTRNSQNRLFQRAAMPADGVDAPARSRASAVPAPHWTRRTDPSDRSPGEELSELVDEDPEAAANILRNWIGQAS